MRIGTRRRSALSLLLSASFAAEPPPNVYAANTGAVAGRCGAELPPPGTVIDAHNVARYDCYLPAASTAVVKHGFKIRIVGTHKFEWPKGFKDATEKYSPQVHLDNEDNLTSYIAGMPFPLVNVYDPKAARKIAYNWHMGPFMPDDFSLKPWGSFAYSDSGGTSKKPVYSEPDYTFICDQFNFLRYAHRTEFDPRPTLGAPTLNSSNGKRAAAIGTWKVKSMAVKASGCDFSILITPMRILFTSQALAEFVGVSFLRPT